MREKQISIAFQTDKSPAEYVSLAKFVDQFNFDVVSVYCDAPYHPSYGPLLLMGTHIKRAKLGPAAVSPFRIHPIDIAANTALLAQVAEGGVYIGLARGAWLSDYGIHQPNHPIQAIRESIEVTRHILSGNSGGYRGEFFWLAEHFSAPYQLPKDEIPLLIGTWGAKLAALAGELADEVKVGGSANPEIVPIVKDYIRCGEKKVNRKYGSVGLVMGAVTVVDDDRLLARRIAKQKIALYLPVVGALDPTVAIEPGLVERIQTLSEERNWAKAGDLISDEILDRFAFAGDENDLITRAAVLFDCGVDRIEFGSPHGVLPEKGVGILGRKVLPVIRSYVNR